MIGKSISAIIIILVLVFGVIWLVDYDRVNKGFNAKFCLKEEEFLYDDGETTVCKGLGYNVFNYNRENNRKIVFAPFWIEMEK